MGIKNLVFVVALATLSVVTRVDATASPTLEPTVFTPQEVSFAEFGWLEERTACAEESEVFTADGVSTIVSGCIPLANYTDLLFINTESGQWNQVPEGRETMYWCPTAARIRLYLSSEAKNRPELRSWGYCYTELTTRDPTPMPTAQPVTQAPSTSPVTQEPSMSPSPQPTPFIAERFFTAQDGWLTEATDCVFGFVQTEKDGTQYDVDGCLPTANYSLFINEDSDAFTASNNTFWCPTVTNFRTHLNPDNDGSREKLKKWGYCSTGLTTRAPTMMPSASPTTASPSMSPSPEPTAFEPVTTYYATGGGVGVSSASTAAEGVNMEPCIIPFKIKGDEETSYTSCVPVTEENPRMDNSSGYPAAPIEGTPLTMWCPIGSANDDRYNNKVDAGKFDRWGYCFGVQSTPPPTEGEGTDAPVASPTVPPTDSTDPPTDPSTDSPVVAPTDSPVNAPTPNGATNAPVTVTDAPVVSPIQGTSPTATREDTPTAEPTAAGMSYSPNLVLAVSLVILTIKLF